MGAYGTRSSLATKRDYDDDEREEWDIAYEKPAAEKYKKTGRDDTIPEVFAECDIEGVDEELDSEDQPLHDDENLQHEKGADESEADVNIRDTMHMAHIGTDGQSDEDDEDEEQDYVGDEEGDGSDGRGVADADNHEDEDEDEDEDDADEIDADEDGGEDEMDPQLAEEFDSFEHSFKNIANRFRLVSKIGEGTFSSVYKAEDMEYDVFDNSWDLDRSPDGKRPLSTIDALSPIAKRQKKSCTSRRKKYVAIKRIYVTSSPQRILNELVLLHTLSKCDSIAPLVTAFRSQDQVVAILPYYKHADYRAFYRQLPLSEFKYYMKSLLTALENVHLNGILHRDVKPTNFLYDPEKRRGVLVDFGLAERESLDPSYCSCRGYGENNRIRHITDRQPTGGYLKNDPRPGRRANRAGTRGFRAPEVLLKCLNQTTKIDMWSAGVILLSFMSKRFPFFNSADDIDAMIEIASIFGKSKISSCARLHGSVFDTNIPTLPDRGFELEEIVDWALSGAEVDDESETSTRSHIDEDPETDLAFDFLTKCLEVDFRKRMSAEQALRHNFLAGI
ncbi:kinase-like domain-containing protein [Lipomyces kononenkoae]|uniref:Kinase-like domain-containing protein n=1 Tax=Lipomyces kononenkoae TaxID=34357 RepID=A0ACC3TAQ8_LIPKO